MWQEKRKSVHYRQAFQIHDAPFQICHGVWRPCFQGSREGGVPWRIRRALARTGLRRPERRYRPVCSSHGSSVLLFLGLLSLGWLPCPPARISCGTSGAILEVGTVELFPRIHTTGCVDLPFTHWPGCPTGPVGCVSTDHTLHDSDTVSKPPGVLRQIRQWKAHVLKACDLPLYDAIPGTCRHLPAKSKAFAPGTLVVYWARQPLVRNRVKTNLKYLKRIAEKSEIGVPSGLSTF